MSLLEISQILFNVVISLAVIIITTLLSVICYDTIQFIKTTKKFLQNVNKESSELYEKINNFLEGIFNLSFVSRFFKKKRNKK